MKRFVWLILLVGMISFTGFSATTDLPEDSSASFIIDHDVGHIEVAVVENFSLKAISCREVYFFRQHSYMIEENLFNINIYYTKTIKREEGSSSNNLYKSKFNFRTARDNL